MRTAYVDESEPGGGLDHTVYVMAAVLIDAGAESEARSAVLRARNRSACGNCTGTKRSAVSD